MKSPLLQTFRRPVFASNFLKRSSLSNHQTALRGSFIAITGHFGAHSGQSIGYARMNRVVPLWTEGFPQQQPAADKPKP
jgi:hypothetical protein